MEEDKAKQVEKDFDVIYQRVYDDCNEELIKLNRKLTSFLAMVALIGIIANIVLYLMIELKSSITITVCLTVIAIIYLIKKGKGFYQKAYKDRVIKALVKYYNPNLFFDEKSDISKYEYSISNFDIAFNDFHSEDQICGELADGTRIRTCEVVTAIIEKTRNANGDVQEQRNETYRGMYGIINLPNNINGNIYISNDSITKRYNRNRIEVDSSEFEKYYDCMADNKVLALRILNSELIEKLNDIRRNYNYGFELKIKDNMIFFRYKCGILFEPPTFKTGLDKNLIRKYYQYIFYPYEIIYKIIDNIKDVVD